MKPDEIDWRAEAIKAYQAGDRQASIAAALIWLSMVMASDGHP